MRHSQAKAFGAVVVALSALSGCTSPSLVTTAQMPHDQTLQVRSICQSTMQTVPGTVKFEDCVASLTETARNTSENGSSGMTSARLACAQLGTLTGPINIEACATELQNKVGAASSNP